MKLMTRRGAWLAALAACLVASARAQDPAVPSFPTKAEAITVDVVVLGRDGKPVRGLTKADFTVLEDGQPQEVVSFEAREMQAGTAEPKAAAAEPVVSNETPRNGRVMALVLDDLGIGLLGMNDVRKAVARWLSSQADPRDEVTLVTTSGDAWWSDRIDRGRGDLLAVLERVKGKKEVGGLSEQISDWEARKIDQEWGSPQANEVADRVVDRWLASGGACFMPDAPPVAADAVKEQARRVCLNRVGSLARQMQNAITTHSVAVFDTIERVSKGLAGGRGRKSIVLFSEGFLRELGERREAAAIDASRRANAAVYFVDSRGLIGLIGAFQAAAGGPPPDPAGVGSQIFGETTLATGGSENLAEETGGFAITNNNDLNAGLVRAANDSAAYYLLGYQPSGVASAKWRKLQVRVDRPGVKVRARQGYFATLPPAPSPATKADPQERPLGDPIDPALLAGGEDAGIPLRLASSVLDEASPTLARIRVVVEVGTAPFVVTDTADGGKVTLDLMLLGASRDKGVVYPIRERIEATLRGKGSRPEWWTFTRDLQLPAGVSQVRALVRDVAAGRMGTVAQRFEVPAVDGLRLAAPVPSPRPDASTADHGQGALEGRDPTVPVGEVVTPTVAPKQEGAIGLEATAPAVDPRLVPVLGKAGQYVLEFERQFRDLSVEESYRQFLTEPGGVTQRVTRSDLVYVAMPGPFAFTCFRDVVEVDGRPIAGRASRLATLFLRESGATAIEKANKILAESAAYNIGARRTVNVPTLALSLLRPDNQRHFRFRYRGKARRAGREVVEVEFEYTSATALVSRTNQEGLPADGRYFIDPADGTVLATELVLRFPGSSASARINVAYELDPGLKVFVPAEMKERYADSGVLLTPDDIYKSQSNRLTPRVFGGVTQTEARYSKYRRFTVTTDESATLPPSP
jgi:VWFA-related protein